MGPTSLAFSLPAAFVTGGIGIGLLPVIWRRRSIGWWLWLVAYGLAVVSAFAGLYAWVLADQVATHHGGMAGYWGNAFVDLRSPTGAMAWFAQMIGGVTFAIPFGGKNFGSALSVILFWIGVLAMWRRGPGMCRTLLGVMFATIGLALIASAMGRYPFGGHARFMQYLTPMLCVPIGAGGGWLVDRFVTQDWRMLWRRGILAALLVIGTAGMLRDAAKPYAYVAAMHDRDFARWFWNDYATRGELICLYEVWHENSDAPGHLPYLFYRYRYAPGVPQGTDAFDATSLLSDQPIGLLISLRQRDDAGQAVQAWIDRLSESHPIEAIDRFPTNAKTRDRAAEYAVVWLGPGPSDKPESLNSSGPLGPTTE